jgi:hypothetical protein
MATTDLSAEQQLQAWSVGGINVPWAVICVLVGLPMAVTAVQSPSTAVVDAVSASAIVIYCLVGSVDRIRTSHGYRVAGTLLICLYGCYMLFTPRDVGDSVIGVVLIVAGGGLVYSELWDR